MVVRAALKMRSVSCAQAELGQLEAVVARGAAWNADADRGLLLAPG